MALASTIARANDLRKVCLEPTNSELRAYGVRKACPERTQSVRRAYAGRTLSVYGACAKRIYVSWASAEG